MSFLDISIKNPILVNMITVLVLILGLYTMVEIPKEEMPTVEFGVFYVIVPYRGTSAEQIEQSILDPIENELADINNIDFMTGSAEEGMATLIIRMLPDADLDQAWNDLNTEMEKVRTLPENAENPMLVRIRSKEIAPIASVSLSGEFSSLTMKEIAENLEQQLEEIENVSKVEIIGLRDREVWIEANAYALDQNGLTVNDITNAIKARNMNLPAGTAQLGNAELLVRTMGEFKQVKEIEELIIKTDANGRAIRVRDVSIVRDTLEEQNLIGKLGAVPSVNLNVFMKSDGNVLAIAKIMHKVVEAYEKSVEGLSVQVRNDSSIQVRNSISSLGSSALLGVALVFTILTIFLGWRNASLAALGIPFSILLSFVCMRIFGITLNNLSIFAFILILGMIVDDAIVVLENIHRHREMGESITNAALKGAREIMGPVLVAALTTMSAFLPLLLMEGNMGKFMAIFPIVVTIALASSLFECFLILPSHVVEFTKNKRNNLQKQNKITQWFVKQYQKILAYALVHRAYILTVVVIAFIASFVVIGMGLVKFEFFPKLAPKTLVLNVKTPVAFSLAQTDSVVSAIEQYIAFMKEQADIEAVVTTVGQLEEFHRVQKKSSYAEIKIDLVDEDKMQYSLESLKKSLRQYVESLSGIRSFSFVIGHRGPPTGRDVELHIRGNDLHTLKQSSEYVMSQLETITGISDIETSMQLGKKELQILPYHDKLAIYGLTVQQVASVVNTSSSGSTITRFRDQSLDEIDVVLRIADAQVDAVAELKKLKIRNQQGQLFALQDLAEFSLTNGLAKIGHRDGNRIVTVTANVTDYEEKGKVKTRTPDEVTAILQGRRLSQTGGLLSDFALKYPGYHLTYGGVAEEQQKSYTSLMVALLLALFLVYAILSAQFRSYIHPIMVMITIPFSLIGVVIGLLITGLPFSLLTLISIVALSGVVVNDSLVLVDFMKREQERGVPLKEAIMTAGSVRLRPILMTTVTTIGGFLPMILSTASSTQMWKPMAVSIAFGLAFATILTLIVIPVLYSLLVIEKKSVTADVKKHCKEQVPERGDFVTV